VAKTVEDFRAGLKFAKEQARPVFIIGGGSNLLISDDGFRGLAIKNEFKELVVTGTKVEVSSGYLLSELINELAERGLSGLENLAGIPGTIGGAIYGNAGSFGSEISDCLLTVIFLDEEGEREELLKNDLESSYRHSIFKKSKKIILSATFQFTKEEPSRVKARVKEVLEKKWATQQPGRTAGSFFKNPKGDFAGRIIEELGFKGYKVGGAMVSAKHANFILNNGKATSKDIYELAEMIKKAAVTKKVTLEEEVQLLGEF
jgi:UDP-N-acetylmuramate dehydrogenase